MHKHFKTEKLKYPKMKDLEGCINIIWLNKRVSNRVNISEQHLSPSGFFLLKNIRHS